MSIKPKSVLDTRLSIFKNILVNGDIITAYYVMHPFNYDIMDHSSAERHIKSLKAALRNLHNSFGEVKMSMFKLRNIISSQKSIEQIVNTVKLYNKDYDDMPDRYKELIKNKSRDYSILAIRINTKQNFDIEVHDMKGIIKRMFDSFVQENFSAKLVNVDREVIDGQNVRIADTIQRYAVPADERLVINIYINSMFPSYNLVYGDYIINNHVPILAGIKQEITPKLGWFEMSNSGVEALGGEARVTYGSVITILSFPKNIDAANFKIALPGMAVNMHLLDKGKATLKFKRMRADVNQELEEVQMAGNNDSDIDEDHWFVNEALKAIRNGQVVTDVDCNILLVADTLEELNSKKKRYISYLSDVNIVSSIAENQAMAFVNSFIKRAPKSYRHVMDLDYALSFQLDGGVMVGDGDNAKFASPVIGHSL